MLKKIFPILIAAALFLLNLYLIYPLFKGEYTQHMGSIEPAFISEGKWISENWKDISWNPLWYMGFPFHLSYAPIVPFSLAFLHWVLPGLSLAFLYRSLIAIFYALGSVTLYFFVRYLTKKNLPAVLAALIFTLPTLSMFLFPGLREEMELRGFFSWRLLVMTVYGEGPHVVSLTLLPLAALAFLYSLRKPSLKSQILAAILGGLVFLTNLIGFFSMLLINLIILFSEIIQGDGIRKFKNALAIGGLTFGLTAFWNTFYYLKITLGYGMETGSSSLLQNLVPLFPFAGLFISLVVVIGLFIFGAKPRLQPIAIVSFWFLAFFLMIGSWWYFKKVYIPQPNRYILELDMVISIICGLIIAGFYNLIQKHIKIVAWVFTAGLVIFLIYLNLLYKKDSWKITSSNQNVTQTSEYRVAKWLSENTKGERVYVTGSDCFWLDVFSNVPQIRGGADGASLSHWWAHATYQINTGENAPRGQEGQVALWWLRALNANFAVVNFPESEEIYHDFRNPSKFKNLPKVEEVYNQKGDVIYKIPLENPGLAQVVDKNKFYDLKPLYNAVDVQNLEKYVSYIDDPSKAQNKVGLFKKKNTEYEIKANLKEGEAIAVQISYFPAWKAYLDGKRIKIQKDVIDFMYIDPQKTGDVQITLKFGTNWDQYFGYLITIFTLGYLIYLLYKRKGIGEKPK